MSATLPPLPRELARALVHLAMARPRTEAQETRYQRTMQAMANNRAQRREDETEQLRLPFGGGA